MCFLKEIIAVLIFLLVQYPIIFSENDLNPLSGGSHSSVLMYLLHSIYPGTVCYPPTILIGCSLGLAQSSFPETTLCYCPEKFLCLPSVLDLVFPRSHIFPFVGLLPHFNRAHLLVVFSERVHRK